MTKDDVLALLEQADAPVSGAVSAAPQAESSDTQASISAARHSRFFIKTSCRVIFNGPIIEGFPFEKKA